MVCWPTKSRGRYCTAACFALTLVFFIAGTGCIQLIDPPRIPEVSAVAEVPSAGDEAVSKNYQMDPLPAARKAGSRPVRRIREQALELPRPQPLTTGREDVAKEDLQTGVSLSMAGKAHAQTESIPPVMAQMTGKSSEKEGASIFLSEAVIFLVVGAIFLLVHLSMRRRLKPVSNTRLAKLLHTRPWR
jgi:hypothetical protein